MKISQETIEALTGTPPPQLPKARDLAAAIAELEDEIGLERTKPSFNMRDAANRLKELQFIASRIAKPAPVAFTAPETATPAPPVKELRGLERFRASVKLEGADTTPVTLHPTKRGRERMLHSLRIQGVKP